MSTERKPDTSPERLTHLRDHLLAYLADRPDCGVTVLDAAQDLLAALDATQGVVDTLTARLAERDAALAALQSDMDYERKYGHDGDD